MHERERTLNVTYSSLPGGVPFSEEPYLIGGVYQDTQVPEDNMKTLVISAVSLFLSLGGAAVAQTTTVVVPGEVKTYVEKQETPSVTFEGDVAVGTALPDTVVIHTIPDQPDYGYVVVNKKRVLVNPKTRTVIEVIK